MQEPAMYMASTNLSMPKVGGYFKSRDEATTDTLSHTDLHPRRSSARTMASACVFCVGRTLSIRAVRDSVPIVVQCGKRVKASSTWRARQCCNLMHAPC